VPSNIELNLSLWPPADIQSIDERSAIGGIDERGIL
jgi:hypothetical protein